MHNWTRWYNTFWRPGYQERPLTDNIARLNPARLSLTGVVKEKVYTEKSSTIDDHREIIHQETAAVAANMLQSEGGCHLGCCAV
jgi:hypothetical protein